MTFTAISNFYECDLSLYIQDNNPSAMVEVLFNMYKSAPSPSDYLLSEDQKFFCGDEVDEYFTTIKMYHRYLKTDIFKKKWSLV